MSLWQRISRCLLIMALVPMIAAAGLPLDACQCSASASEAVCGSYDGASVSCCGEGRCECCSAKKTNAKGATSDCCGKATNRASEKNSQHPHVKCQCAGERTPQPTAPASPSVELVSSFAVPTTFVAVAPLPPVVTGSCERAIATLLPSDDLPTILCTLLI